MFNRRNAVPIVTAEWLLDVQGFTMVQRAMYHALLQWAWANQGRVPDDIEQLAAVCGGMTAREFEAHQPIVMKHFALDAGFWVHGRMVSHLKGMERKQIAARANGKKGGRPKKVKAVVPAVKKPPIVKPVEYAFAGAAIKPIENPSNNPAETQVITPAQLPYKERRVAISVLIRGLEEKRGIAPIFVSADAIVADWAQRKISDVLLRDAYAVLVAQPEFAHKPVIAAHLAPVLDDLLGH